MIEIKNVSKFYGEKCILNNISLNFQNNDKVGVVGENGAGKTTLLKSIINDDYTSSGTINYFGSTIGFIEQNIDSSSTVYEYFLELFPEIKKLEHKIKKMDNNLQGEKTNYEEYIDTLEKYEALRGYEFVSNVKYFLGSFHFEKEDINRKMNTFSGGQKTKLSLIRLLLKNSDYMILDEPTNNLDIDTIEWLERYLKKSKKGLIIVSHDQDFINNICNKIVEIHNTKADVYNTNFNNYLKQKQLNYEIKLHEYEKNQKLLVKYKQFIEKNKETPSKVGQVNDRKRKLEKLEVLEKPVIQENTIDFKFKDLNLKRSTYIDFFNVDIGYDRNTLIKDFNFKVYGGEKICLVGANGTGKTTLFKAILERKGLSGKIKIPSKIKIGYFDQEQKNLESTKTLYDIAYNLKKFDSDTAIRKYLGRFNFKRSDVFKKVTDLSGGEKVRLELLRLSLFEYDILLLDEPTNHLDFATKSILETTLQSFNSTIVFISHDRHFINMLADKILYLDNKKIISCDGNWSDYIHEKNNNEILKKDIKSKQKKVFKDDVKVIKKKNLQKANLLEKEIIMLENKKKEIEILLKEEKNIKDFKKYNELLEELFKLQKELKEMNEKYYIALGV